MAMAVQIAIGIIAGVPFFGDFILSSPKGFFAQAKEGTYLSFLVEILTAQLVIYVNIDDDIKNHFTHAEKNI